MAGRSEAGGPQPRAPHWTALPEALCICHGWRRGPPLSLLSPCTDTCSRSSASPEAVCPGSWRTQGRGWPCGACLPWTRGHGQSSVPWSEALGLSCEQRVLLTPAPARCAGPRDNHSRQGQASSADGSEVVVRAVSPCLQRTEPGGSLAPCRAVLWPGPQSSLPILARAFPLQDPWQAGTPASLGRALQVSLAVGNAVGGW